jgi:hypothetical protein
MDWTADKRSNKYQFDPAASIAEIEAFAAAAQAASNASLYEVVVGDAYVSVPDSNNALEEVWENVQDNLVIQAKTALGASIRGYIVSPINAMFLTNTDDIDPASAVLIAYLAAFVALLPAGYEVVGARFTSRRDINQQIPI